VTTFGCVPVCEVFGRATLQFGIAAAGKSEWRSVSPATASPSVHMLIVQKGAEPKDWRIHCIAQLLGIIILRKQHRAMGSKTRGAWKCMPCSCVVACKARFPLGRLPRVNFRLLCIQPSEIISSQAKMSGNLLSLQTA
jgi:hypothetical protein